MKIDASQRTLYALGFLHPRSRLSRFKLNSLIESKVISTVGIVYRQCGEGKGTHHDHYTLQKNASTRTCILKPSGLSTEPFNIYMKQVTHHLPFEIDVKTIDEETPSSREFGLLFIPGASKQSYDHKDFQKRKDYQTSLIKKARLEGRPILAICGGCWQLWQEFEGRLKVVKDHNYRGGMMRIKETTGKVGHNKQIHRIRFLSKNLMISRVMTKNSEDTTLQSVNSVHWLAPSEEKIPKFLEVSALSVADETLAPKVVHQDETRLLNPEECIEAFESKYGAPIIGIQWHPEAYYKNTKDISIVDYMIQAGKTYLIKKNLLDELKDLFNEKLNKTTLKWTHLSKVTPEEPSLITTKKSSRKPVSLVKRKRKKTVSLKQQSEDIRKFFRQFVHNNTQVDSKIGF